VIVDFSNLPEGAVIRMLNTGPDAPFGGFPADPADPATTGQVMQFVVRQALLQPGDALTTPPEKLKLPSESALPPTTKVRQVTLNEEESTQLCVQILADGSITTLFNNPAPGDPNFTANCSAAGGFPMAPKAAKLGMFTTDPVSGMTMSMPMMWGDMITENPLVGDTESWEIYNFTMDAHPIHLHLVRFQVIDRQEFDMMTMAPIGNPVPAAPFEAGYKDTVIAYPGQLTRITAKFDRGGQYVWHCHILEHEDNEMMRPYLVRFDPQFPDFNGDNRVDKDDLVLIVANLSVLRPVKLAYDLNQDGKVDVRDMMMVIGKLGRVR
jgi:FtsP/CotA-like multicopper oxidase with cupredoxin domain